MYTLFYIRTSNSGAEAKRSYFFCPENVLKTEVNYKLNCFSVYHAIRKLGILVNFPVRLQFYIIFTYIYTTHQKMSKIKTFLTDSQPGYVLSMFLVCYFG